MHEFSINQVLCNLLFKFIAPSGVFGTVKYLSDYPAQWSGNTVKHTRKQWIRLQWRTQEEAYIQ